MSEKLGALRCSHPMWHRYAMLPCASKPRISSHEATTTWCSSHCEARNASPARAISSTNRYSASTAARMMRCFWSSHRNIRSRCNTILAFSAASLCRRKTYSFPRRDGSATRVDRAAGLRTHPATCDLIQPILLWMATRMHLDDFCMWPSSSAPSFLKMVTGQISVGPSAREAQESTPTLPACPSFDT